MDEQVGRFGREVADRLLSVLGDGVVGVYFVGSVALGGYVAGESDIDIAAVCRRALDEDAKRFVVEAVELSLASCPARGLEFSLYAADVVSAAPHGADFEVNVNGGPRMEHVVRVDPEGQPAFWYILDRGIARRSGVVIVGPAAAEVFGEVDRPSLLQAMAESMRWHREHERATFYSVLNAARAWRFAETDELGSKLEGASWAARRWSHPAVIDAAVELRHGRRAHLDAAEVDELLEHVQQVLAANR